MIFHEYFQTNWKLNIFDVLSRLSIVDNATGKCHGTQQDCVVDFMNLSGIFKKEERFSRRENDEKLISHGERTIHAETEIRRTNPIHPRDDYWSKTGERSGGEGIVSTETWLTSAG